MKEKERMFNIGDKVVCGPTGVKGTVIKFYTPTSCEEQTMVDTGDGVRYHAPTRMWSKMGRGRRADIVIFDERAYDENSILVGVDLSSKSDMSYTTWIEQNPNIKKPSVKRYDDEVAIYNHACEMFKIINEEK